MDTITVHVGKIVATDNFTQDDTREVQFVGEKLATYKRFVDLGGTRGVAETLYRTEDGRLIVHVADWSQWVNEPNYYLLFEVTESDLQVGGRFEALGHEAGFGRPLTLDEALSDLSELGDW